MIDSEAMRQTRSGRRAFLSRMSAAGLGAAAVALVKNPQSFAAPSAPVAEDDVVGPSRTVITFPGIPGRNINEQVLNYALTLEILEADLYRQALNAASGKSLAAPLSDNQRDYRLTVPPGSISAATAHDLFGMLLQFTYVEAAHRDFVRAAIVDLGGDPVPPNPRGYRFPQGIPSNLQAIMRDNILPLEETGVRAYLGALPAIQGLTLAQTAGTIYSTEARHSGVISYMVGLDPGPTKMPGDRMVVPVYPAQNTFEYFLLPAEVIPKAQTFFA